MDDLRQENIILEEYISETKNYSKMIEKSKQENDCLQLIRKKNISTIFSKILSFIRIIITIYLCLQYEIN